MDELMSQLQTFTEGWKTQNPGIKIFYTIENETLVLHLIELPPTMRNQGYGHEIMEELTCIADRFNLYLKCSPDPNKGTPLEVLDYFYGKHGFVWEDSQRMIRVPLYSDFFAQIA